MLEKTANKETWEQVKEILISSKKLETLSSTILIQNLIKNEAGFKMIEPKTSDMDIDSEPLTLKPRTESPQRSNIIIQEEVEGERQEVPT